jgi:hypothetical protein
VIQRNVRFMISMVKMPLRKEWAVEDPMLIHLTSSHHFLDPLLEVLYPYSFVTVFLVRSFIKCDNDWLLFVLFAGGGGSSRGRRQRRGEDVVHPLKVSLEDLYNGTSKKLSLSRNVICSKCKGLVLFALTS